MFSVFDFGCCRNVSYIRQTLDGLMKKLQIMCIVSGMFEETL